MLSCDDAAEHWHRRWHRNVISAIAECALIGALAVPLIGVTSALGGDDAIHAMFLVFKTGVSSVPAQAGSIPVRLRSASDLAFRASPPSTESTVEGTTRPVVNGLSMDPLGSASWPSRISRATVVAARSSRPGRTWL